MAKLSTSILKIKNFRLLLLGRMCAIMAMQAQAVIVGWQIYSITGSTFMLGLTGLVEAIPAIICALYAGHIVDTRHPKKVFAACVSVLTINTFILALFGGGYIHVENNILVLIIFTGIFVSGLARSFIMPSAFTLLPMIIERKDISSAASWQTTCFQIAMIGGPTIAGVLYGFYGAQSAWMLPTIMMGLAAIFVSMISVQYARDKTEKRPSAAKNIKEGWVFLLQNRSLLSIMSLDMLAVLFGGAIAILPAFADQVLHLGPEAVGVLRAAPAAGAILTALYFALVPMKKVTAVRMLLVVGGFGVSMIGFGLSINFWMAFAFLALSGAFDSVSMVIRGTLMQLLTPEKMRGRVSSVNSMFIISSNEIGAFESGLAASLFGLVPSILIGGVGTLVVVGFTALLSPKFRKLSIET